LEEFKKTGAPLIRPLNYAFPEVSEFHQKHPTAFMVGDRWLIFPDVRKTNGRRTLVLPPGNWYHPENGGKPVKGKIRVKSGVHCFVSEKDWLSNREKSDVDQIWNLMKSAGTPH
jgi:alpha-glucosidase (family GH31 glycosyl hydrolase)